MPFHEKSKGAFMSNQSSHVNQPSNWAIGFAAFAGVMMITIGLFQAIAGLAAVWNDTFYAVTANYIFEFSVSAWGWIHLIVGVLVLLAGLGVFSGAVWARTVGVFFAVLSGLANFMFLPYSPIWATLIIALDVAVIWALTAHGRDISET